MFGYVIANREIMTEEQIERYRAYYCGLCQELKEAYGEKAEPLYDRLVKYMQILRNNRFILFVGRDRVKA